uniref:Uncharacterized protein n=1 Tax=Anguilla anguilla TaxID=7936 RepID=A0A0E9Q7Z7_ANGAN
MFRFGLFLSPNTPEFVCFFFFFKIFWSSV